MPVRDYSQYKEDNTLAFTVECLDGSLKRIVVPPLDKEAEQALYDFQKRGFESLQLVTGKRQQTKEDKEKEAQRMGEYWAPLIVACAREPEGLTAEWLVENCYGTLLRDMGSDIIHFFTFGTLEKRDQESKE